MATLLCQLVLDGMGMGLIYVMLAVGLVLIMSVSRIFFIAYGQFYMIGAYVAWGVISMMKLPFVVSLCIAVLATTVLGLLSYRFIFHYIQSIENTFLSMIVAAIGLMMVLGQGGLIAFGTVARGIPSVMPGIVSVGGITVPVEKLVLMGLSLIVTFGLFFLYEKTNIGRAMRAVAFRPDAASLQGVNTERIYLVTMGIGCGLAGFAGGIMAPVYVVYPEMGSDVILSVLLIVMLGGRGSMVGAVLGGLVFGLTLSFGQYFVGRLAQLLLFVTIGILVFFRPGGLLGRATEVEL
jgi:branched-chain amino acid transport system permease protein